MADPELTDPVDLCNPDGTVNPAAIGWSRRPLHRANLHGWGRTKRWEHWCVTTPTHLLALTVADLDFLRLHALYFLDFAGPTPREVSRATIAGPARSTVLPEVIAGSAAGTDVVVGPRDPGRFRLRIAISAVDGGTRLQARTVTDDGAPLDADVTVTAPAGHESLSVVVPWSPRRFQYTSKHVARPAHGAVHIGQRAYPVGEDAWGTLDHGRGRWPRSVRWNWGAAAGRTDGHVVGLQFGGRWTDHTGTTENALCVDGRLTRIPTDLHWEYDRRDYLRPWTVRTRDSDQVAVTFTPFHYNRARAEAGLLATRTDQCFGYYRGHVRTEEGTRIAVEDLLGWAEDVAMRW
ncbi:DUF2804 domain-containing protein [Mycobacterium koreense]|uniref:Uncharacterized protein n=1 Tax=Mycolicibacillus koreensis TaxID=1069220 RepID=A0A7I7SGI1_9MYCO|nr:DUF2804 domain-containing protein [Mycolicibacillus koreensis]MCV7248160.1 DUF2804 domain-containing protein [Mycolicibacillus koreensis]OSC35728.1 hypothetical protein B8W67_01235 [Mycolicibacillus koreensis]BBY55096.1 hypothetical protein MKOR_23470 [Mycolicibacillus koreensis]